MPIEKQYKLRRYIGGEKGRGNEITVPPDWCRFHQIKTGEDITVLADGVVILLPPNISEAEEERVRNFLERN